MSRKEPVILENRVISGRGIFIIPPNDNYRHFYLYVSVIRRPPVNYLNSRWNPDRSDYAHITWIRNDYVLREDTINYESQLLEYPVDITGYLCNALVCGFNGVSNYFDYLCTALGITPLPSDPESVIYTQPLRNYADTIKIVCRGATALDCKLYYLEYDNNCQQESPNPKEPPDPPVEPPVFDDIPVDSVSPPYSQPNDGGDTIFYPGDTSPVPEGGDTGDTQVGSIYAVTYTVRQFPGGSLLTRGGILVLGVVGDLRFKPDGSKVTQIWAQGRVLNPFAPPAPSPPGWIDIQDEDDRATDLSLVSVSPYP